MKLRVILFPTPFDKTLARWHRDKGDEKRRLQYNLTANSVVIDVGGFEGNWTAAIVKRYNCRVLVFEPVPAHITQLLSRFKGCLNVTIFPFGLGVKNERLEMYVAGEGSSLLRPGGLRTDVEIREAGAFFKSNAITDIDLMKINIEGAEYDLLDHILNIGLIEHIRDLQIQFHRDIPAAPQRREHIRNRLMFTHEITYDYPFVWENWHCKL